MCVGKQRKKIKINLSGKRIQPVKRFTYLGSIITKDSYAIEDVKTRLAMAKRKFAERREIFVWWFEHWVEEKASEMFNMECQNLDSLLRNELKVLKCDAGDDYWN